MPTPLSRMRSIRAQGADAAAARWYRRYLYTGDESALRRALGAQFDAVRNAGEHDPEKPRYLSNLVTVLSAVFEMTGDREHLALAVGAGRAAVSAMPAGDAGLAMALSNLSGALAAWYRYTDERDSLDEAVRTSERAVAEASPDDPDRAQYSLNLSNVLFLEYGLGAGPDILDRAVAAAVTAVRLSDDEEPEHGTYLANLAMLRRTVFQHRGDETALAQAIAAGRAAVAVTDRDNPRRGRILAGLAGVLYVEADRAGDPVIIAEAERTLRDALDALPADAPDRSTIESNLAVILSRSFERDGDTTALADAIAIGRQLLDTTPAGPDRHRILANHAGVLLRMHERVHDMESVHMAVELGRAAVASVSDDHPNRLVYQGNLGTALLALSDNPWFSDALDEAIDVERAAARIVPDGHSMRPVLLSNLGLALRTRFERTGDATALTEAVEWGRAALTGLSDDHPDGTRCRINLGVSLLAQGNADEARHVFEAGVAGAAAPVPMRIEAAEQLANACTLSGDHTGAVAATRAAIGLLPLIAPRQLGRSDREHRLGAVAGIGARGAAAALAAGAPEDAVTLLEQARGVLLAEAMDTRREPTALLEHAPDLVAGYRSLLDRFAELEQAEPPADADVRVAAGPSATLARQRAAASADWDRLLVTIRSRPGLADFLAAPAMRELRAQATGGPIVLVSATDTRCDALIVTADGPVRHVPLPGVTQDIIIEQAEALHATLAAHRSPQADRAGLAAAERGIGGILKWLWDNITGPILDAIGHTATPREDWPRLWWCPVGVLALLPLHAAGHHDDPADRRRSVLDRVVSSYTVTIRSLGYVRERARPAAGQRAVIVAAPDAVPSAPIRGAAREIDELRALLPGATILRDDDATFDSVHAALPGHAVAHFACHGLTDDDHPGASRLLLTDHAIRPLTVAAISRLRMTGARLAYLSACSTTSTDVRLADEAVHITAAFQLAGYCHVVGTLWPVGDTAARTMAVAVYRGLTGNGTTPPDTDRTAFALHAATRALRVADRPTRWIPYVHYGA